MPAMQQSQEGGQETVYNVRSGDTLANIANRFQVGGGHQELAAHNNISNPNLIRVGQAIRIPGSASGGGGQSSGATTYTVKRGDTLGKIADRFDYPGGHQALARANGIADPNMINVGQELKVSADGGGGSAGGGQEEQQSAEAGGGQQSAPPAPPAQDSGGQASQQEEQAEESSSQEGEVAKDAAIEGEGSWIDAAVAYNRGRYSRSVWRQLQEAIGTAADGVPGKKTARAVYRWQEANQLTKDGQLGPATAATIDVETGGGGSEGGQEQEGEETEHTGPVDGLRQKIVDIAHSTLSTRTGHNYYSQPGAMSEDPLAKAPLRSDCSQWVRAVYLKAGAGDPGTYTGAMVGRAQKTSSPQPGDLLLKSGHVELYIGNGETIGHGSPPINKGSVSYWKGKGLYFATYDFLNR